MRGAYSSLYYFYIFAIFSYIFISPGPTLTSCRVSCHFSIIFIHSFICLFVNLLIYLVVYLFIYQLFFLFILGAGGMPGKRGGGGLVDCVRDTLRTGFELSVLCSQGFTGNANHTHCCSLAVRDTKCREKLP